MAVWLRRATTMSMARLSPCRTIWRSFNDLPEGIVTKAQKEKDKAEFARLLENNKRWVDHVTSGDPQFFQCRSQGQSPQYLWIGCSDSRVPVETLTGLESGEIFVHRNVANLVVNTDINMLSVLSYAVEALKVKHVVVCGHYGCGGVKAACEATTNHGIIEHWLRSIRDVQRLHWSELAKLEDREEQYRRLVELNVAEQCLNLFKTGIVQASRLATGYPLVHGLIYDLETGQLSELNMNLKESLRKYMQIYKLI